VVQVDAEVAERKKYLDYAIILQGLWTIRATESEEGMDFFTDPIRLFLSLRQPSETHSFSLNKDTARSAETSVQTSYLAWRNNADIVI
jgi:hypothetical protein